MSNESRTGSEIRISEADLRRILDRAIQLDTLRTNEVTLAELQRVADEVGISSGSITQAIEEYRLGQMSAEVVLPTPAEIPGWRARLNRFARPLIMGGLSTMVAFFTAAAGAEEAALATYFLSIAASLVLAVVHRMRRHDAIVSAKTSDPTEHSSDAGKHRWALQVDLLALWLPWTFLNGLAEEEIFVAGSLAWALAAIVGTGIVALRQPKHSAGMSQERSAAPGAAV